MKVQFTLQPFLKRSNSVEFLTFDSAMIETAPRGSETEVFYTAFTTALKLDEIQSRNLGTVQIWISRLQNNIIFILNSFILHFRYSCYDFLFQWRWVAWLCLTKKVVNIFAILSNFGNFVYINFRRVIRKGWVWHLF